ncbi:hypothetical protein ACSNN5_19370 [Brevibacillus formosus]|uniref:hypothetical protein n=1 Tax=Brevibacillus formosus TaxID=54913 RepID=UPI003F1D5B65
MSKKNVDLDMFYQNTNIDDVPLSYLLTRIVFVALTIIWYVSTLWQPCDDAVDS